MDQGIVGATTVLHRAVAEKAIQDRSMEERSACEPDFRKATCA